MRTERQHVITELSRQDDETKLYSDIDVRGNVIVSRYNIDRALNGIWAGMTEKARGDAEREWTIDNGFFDVKHVVDQAITYARHSYHSVNQHPEDFEAPLVEHSAKIVNLKPMLSYRAPPKR
jgi:hypothetical protein